MITNFRRMTRSAGLLVLLLSLCITGVSAYPQEAADIIALVTAATEPQTLQRLDSPDGAWYAEVIVYPCVDIGDQVASYEQLLLTNTETGETQQVAEQVISCGGLGAFGLLVDRWSESGAFLYYTDAREGVPDGDGAGWAPTLWRVRVDDMHAESLGMGRFSPDGRWLAVWNQERVRVMPVDAGDGVDFALLPETMRLTSVNWLPDSSGIIYIQGHAFGESPRSAVTHIDTERGDQTVIFNSESS
jgi:hypothetical protein